MSMPITVEIRHRSALKAAFSSATPEALERMERIDTLVVDKTVPSRRQPRLTTVVAAEERPKKACCKVAASLERGSEHPLALRSFKGPRSGITLLTAGASMR